MAVTHKNTRENTSYPNREQASLALDQAVSTVRLVSPKRAEALKKLGIQTVRQLVNHYPRRYIDLSHVATIVEAKIGSSCTIRATIHKVELKKPRPRLALVEIALVDNTGILIVTAFRQPWLMKSLSEGMVVAVAGKVEFAYGYKRMTNPFIEVLDEQTSVEGSIIPVHPATEALSAAWMRRLVESALQDVRGVYDPLPLALRMKYRLMSRGSALASIQFPRAMEEVGEARRRLAFEELFMLQLFMMHETREREAGKTAVAHIVDGPHMQALQASLPFDLTSEQMFAISEISAALGAPHAANHLLLGDVGTGKTVVAAHALAMAADTKGQVLFMAPTEVLARQHEHSVGQLLDAAGITHAVLTGSTSAPEREDILSRLTTGELDVLFGTHALLEPAVRPTRMTLAVIDEQQRFGVNQRAQLLAKAELPDALYLTATPIPRSLALALFGNFTLSYLRERPHATAARETFVLPKKEVGQAYDAACAALEAGHQVFVVCPLIGKDATERDARAAHVDEVTDEGFHPAVAIEDDGDFVGDDVAAATKEAEFLATRVFPGYQVELLHGALPAAEKQAVMQRVTQGDTQVLVSTTVIEVGVDVPNATVMIIQDADRFGLSQLHQLRGRVGRGIDPAQVYLVSASQKPEALERLAVMESTDDGFKLAEHDLSLRREGDILGNRQSGATHLKLVNVARDKGIVEAAHADARAIMDVDPHLELPEHKALARELRILFGQHKAVTTGG